MTNDSWRMDYFCSSFSQAAAQSEAKGCYLTFLVFASERVSLVQGVSALVLAPTRELVLQLALTLVNGLAEGLNRLTTSQTS